MVDNEPLVLEFNINASTLFDMTLLESSFDLMQNPLFTMNKRADWMMPTPFVLNDAVAIKKAIKPSSRVIPEPEIVPESKVNPVNKNVMNLTSIPEEKSISVAKNPIAKPKPKARIPLKLIDAPIDSTR